MVGPPRDDIKRRGARLTAARRASAARIRAEFKEHGRPPIGEEPALFDASNLCLGDPTKEKKSYKPEYCDIVREICQLGGTDIQVARALHVSLSVLWSWQARYEEFFKAFLAGKDFADDRVERALYHRAVGYSHPQVKIFNHQGTPVVVPYIEHLPPDVGAASRWLKSRRKEVWAEKTEINLSGDEAFNQMWQAISTGQVLPLLTGEPLDGDGDDGVEP